MRGGIFFLGCYNIFSSRLNLGNFLSRVFICFFMPSLLLLLLVLVGRLK